MLKIREQILTEGYITFLFKPAPILSLKMHRPSEKGGAGSTTHNAKVVSNARDLTDKAFPHVSKKGGMQQIDTEC